MLWFGITFLLRVDCLPVSLPFILSVKAFWFLFIILNYYRFEATCEPHIRFIFNVYLSTLFLKIQYSEACQDQ